MRRVTKQLLVFLFGAFFTVFCCEYLIYYVVIAQCSWPKLQINGSNQNVLKALILADIHLLGPKRGHWFDKMRRESQMHRAFQTIITIHKPEAVFVLGDLFDEGELSSDKKFDEYVARFYRLFAVPNTVSMHIVVGNHDIGFHNYMRRGSPERFFKAMNSSSVQSVVLKDSHFVLINSMAMEGDKCNMCVEARRNIDNISEALKCAQFPEQCESTRYNKVKFSRPILMQHFPLYRKSDAICTEPDTAPIRQRNSTFKPKFDTYSKEATEYLISKIKPRAVFGGHTHHECLVHHDKQDSNFYEYSVPSFSWRNRPDPKYILASITPEDYKVHKCGLPLETTMVLLMVLLLITLAWCTLSIRRFGRRH